MKKKSATSKKAATKKAPPKRGALKRFAAKAIKIVKAQKPARKAPVAAKKPVKESKTVASRPHEKAADRSKKPSTLVPASKAALAVKTKKYAAAGSLTENDVRRMGESDYMNESQLEFFRQRLLQMRQEVLDREVDVKERLNQREVFADPADRATAEEEHWLDLRLRERESLLLKKIDDALRRIKEREYGFCEVTGEPIGIPRLLARPTATVCVDVKGQNEQIESQYRDR